jgi:hypothetical protein
MQTKKGALNFVCVGSKLSLSAGPSPWPPPSYNSVVDKRISCCYNPQKLKWNGKKKKQKYSLLSNEQSKRSMVCLYLREWLPTGTRSPDPATLCSAVQNTHTHTAHAHDRHRSFRAGIIICMLWERCTKVDSRALFKKKLYTSHWALFRPVRPKQSENAREGEKSMDIT